MAYSPNNLSALTYANGFTLWHYRSSDLSGVIDSSGYFNEAVSMLRSGDFIIANTNSNGTIESGIFIVKINDGKNVDVANISSFGLANTD